MSLPATSGESIGPTRDFHPVVSMLKNIQWLLVRYSLVGKYAIVCLRVVEAKSNLSSTTCNQKQLDKRVIQTDHRGESCEGVNDVTSALRNAKFERLYY